ncbi:hypothetical protein HCG53_13695 [Pseudomonas brassicacearum]|uniref:MltR family transcriptional regulator n=1 Tax=Pseudomonas TaxID=286 RepID=UPI0012F80AE3|nr:MULTISPECIES: MltR family transcriptional regulator [Pseudomonas]NJP61468.1 hypothetical protein [Pseudomonas brassicacearum]
MRSETKTLINESDRGCVIIAAVILEKRLVDDISAIFAKNELSNRYMSHIFDGNGALGNFSSKILVAKGMGLISGEVMHDLMVIRKMRNEFAHSLTDVSFSDPKVKSRIDSMFFARRAKESMKDNPAFNLSDDPNGPPVYSYKSIFCIAVKDLDIYLLEARVLRSGLKIRAEI